MRKKKCEHFLQKLTLFTGHIRIWFVFLECPHLMLIFAMPLMILLVLNCSTKVSEKSAMPLMILLVLNCSTKVSEKSDMAKS